jgi:hypothetical protein
MQKMVALSERGMRDPLQTNFGEFLSLLKKWVSARSALQESLKTSPKHYENDVFGLRTGVKQSAKAFFNTLFCRTKFSLPHPPILRA